MAKIDALLAKAAESGASDIHISVGSPTVIRRFGTLMKSRTAEFNADQIRGLLQEILTPAQKAELEKNWEVDFAYEIPGVARFRCNAFVQHKGTDICFRVIRLAVPTLDELGIPETVKRQLDHHQGLILVTGSAGSGKSTTLAAMVNHINTHRPHHVLTVEDPIEYVHPIKKGAINQRQLGGSTKSYGNALKAALREDPDVIVVGDLRDLETITLAISASETGHLVVGSMNTSSAAKTIDKIIDSYPAGQQNQIRAMLGESLKAVFTQRLLPKADGKGMALAYELLLGSRQLASLIKDAKTFQIPNLMQTGKSRGMRLMDDVLLELLKKGEISQEAALRNAANPKLFPGGAAVAAAQEAAEAQAAGAAVAPPAAPKPGAPTPGRPVAAGAGGAR